MHRDSDDVPFYIRVVLPYDIPAAGYEDRISKTYPVRYAELEWKLSEPGVTFTETTFGDNTYRLYSKPQKTWAEAKADCESRGAHLVTIDSDEENDAMVDLLEEAAESDAWIGLYQDSGAWQWVDDAGMKTPDFRKWAGTPTIHHKHAEITSSGKWKSYEDATRANAYICELEAPGLPSDKATLTLVSALDSDTAKDPSMYRLHIRLNGNLIYSGTPPVEHCRLEGGDIMNFKDLEIRFDRQYLRGARNLLKVSLSNVGKQHWFAWDSLKIDGSLYKPSPQRWQLYSPTDVDGVYGGEIYSCVFDVP